MKFQVYSSCCWEPSLKLMTYPGAKSPLWKGRDEANQPLYCVKCSKTFTPTKSNIKAE